MKRRHPPTARPPSASDLTSIKGLSTTNKVDKKTTRRSSVQEKPSVCQESNDNPQPPRTPISPCDRMNRSTLECPKTTHQATNPREISSNRPCQETATHKKTPTPRENQPLQGRRIFDRLIRIRRDPPGSSPPASIDFLSLLYFFPTFSVSFPQERPDAREMDRAWEESTPSPVTSRSASLRLRSLRSLRSSANFPSGNS